MVRRYKNKISNGVYPEVKLKDVFRAFWRGVKPQKWLFILVIFFIIVPSVIGAINPVLYKNFFDIISTNGDKTEIGFRLIKIITEILFLNGIAWVCYRIAVFGFNYFESKTIARLKQQSYEYLIDHSYNFFSNNYTGALVQRVNRFARAFEILTDRITWDVFPLFIKIILIVSIVYIYNKWIALLLFVWIVVFLLVNICFSIWKLKYDVAVAEVDSKATGYLSDTISNQNTVHLFSGKEFEVEGYKKVTSEQAQKTNFNWNLDAMMSAVQAFLGILIQFLLFYFAIKYWQKGLVTVGIFVLLQSYIIYLIDQFWEFARVVRSVYQAYADAKEMVEILLLPHEITDTPTAKELIVKKGEIKFEGLNFSFNQTRKVLEDINLEIKAGEKIALIGPSGAGKTTFIRLLLRLYSATSGKILIDNQDISEATQNSLRKNISLVPQDPILFHRTLAQNIAYGKRDATEEEIKRAASLAHCDEFIKNLQLGFETYVGERGIKLSGGERQRIAIARAILKNSPILILDEATSSLDSRSEALIQDALNNLMKDKTTIVIAHRLSTIQKMDRIILIDGGKVVEEGTHQSLLKKKNSLYKKLWELQAGGFLKDKV